MSRAFSLVIASLALTVSLGACSSPAKSTAPSASPTPPKVSVEPSSPSSSATSDFDEVVAFVTAIYLDHFDDAGRYVADDTTAARYVANLRAVDQVDGNNGGREAVDPDSVNVEGDPTSNSVSVEVTDDEGDHTYVWRDFMFTREKIASWSVKGKPALDGRLWHANAADKAKGVKASLVSAYESNDGTLVVVVDLASKSRNVRVIEASYAPKGGYRQQDAAGLSSDVDKGGKTLTYFNFNKSRLGGKIKLSIDQIDSSDQSSSTSLTTLTLDVR